MKAGEITMYLNSRCSVVSLADSDDHNYPAVLRIEDLMRGSPYLTETHLTLDDMWWLHKALGKMLERHGPELLTEGETE